MKRTTRLLSATALLFVACTKNNSNTGTTPSTPTTPTTPAAKISTFNITIGNHSYKLDNSYNTNSGTVSVVTAKTEGRASNYSNSQCIAFTGQAADVTGTGAGAAKQVNALIIAEKSDLSAGTGIYKRLNVTIIDAGDGGKRYSEISDTANSQINVTVSDASQVKGTFSFKMLYNGSTVPITGDFDVKK